MQDFSKFKPDNSAFYVRRKTRIIEAITHASIMAMVFLAGGFTAGWILTQDGSYLLGAPWCFASDWQLDSWPELPGPVYTPSGPLLSSSHRPGTPARLYAPAGSGACTSSRTAPGVTSA